MTENSNSNDDNGAGQIAMIDDGQRRAPSRNDSHYCQAG
jgi:hypothetical protein